MNSEEDNVPIKIYEVYEFRREKLAIKIPEVYEFLRRQSSYEKVQSI